MDGVHRTVSVRPVRFCACVCDRTGTGEHRSAGCTDTGAGTGAGSRIGDRRSATDMGRCAGCERLSHLSSKSGCMGAAAHCQKGRKNQLHRQNNGHADGIHVYASRVYTDKRDDKTGSCQPRSDSDNGRCTWNTGYAGSNIQRSKQSDDFLECRGRRNRL